MRRLAVLGVVIAGLLLTACSTAPTAVGKVDPATFLAEVAAPSVVVLDVRSPAEFAAGHLPGATNIDVEGPGFAAAVSTLDPTKTYAVYCRSGRRSAVAAEELSQLGFSHVIDLEGGLVDLQAAGAQVVTP